MTGERLIYLPLGGAGEIGMNAYVFGWGRPGQEQLLVVDLGVTFGNMETTPGIDLILPDIAWLEERRERIMGIVVTHAHEDHIGALAHVWPRLRAPIHARPFTAAIARLKLEEREIVPDEALHVAPTWPGTVTIGPFRVGFVPISHSIPESAGLVIDTPGGRIVHSADFKIDRHPVVGEAFDSAVWEAIGREGVLALTCDSTNVFVGHPGRSESSLREPLGQLMREATGLVVATTFASNVARLKTLADAAREAGRSVCLLGRAMKRMVDVAQDTGLLTDFPPTVAPEDAADIPRENLLILATGSQGEPRAATAQLAAQGYMGLTLREGDTFLFSSRTIPGNERSVIRIMNQLSEKGVDVIDDEGGRYHVSGHANRPDLETFHRLIAPRWIIPMHGEHRHLREHVKLAEAGGFAAVLATNGMMVDLSGDAPRLVEQVETGRVYLDGTAMIGAMDGVVRDRLRMARNGHVTVTLILDEEEQPLGEPWCDLMGLPERGRSQDSLRDLLESELSRFVERADARTIRDDERLEKEMIRIVRQTAQNEIGKKPEVTVVVSRLA
ncbi:putative hydrolase of the metallo-beta-lactamase superfamily [Rubellimicrobium thermophilum DSM 16684]|uniref:Putative hydrolase of the metallo-beta-lactamase superfamily n=1 Tax=Rubellimicrobium thermophilum DSM 16684 TaxID=1123069 RepID=S9S912_9RHOB|nr:ribonuclease J [Rubellimicrobium thermophilum]EPX86625.1 putative hydrolase of the metallo-beta-lactamase superfamily [Rubellimicrobium thermophilum DSM 16684]